MEGGGEGGMNLELFNVELEAKISVQNSTLEKKKTAVVLAEDIWEEKDKDAILDLIFFQNIKKSEEVKLEKILLCLLGNFFLESVGRRP